MPKSRTRAQTAFSMPSYNTIPDLISILIIACVGFTSSNTSAKSGIFASVVLGVGRAIGETMAVMMVAGNQTVIPEKITDGVRTLTTNIVMEMGYSTDLHREALIATAVVLFVFILIINLSFSLLKRRSK